MCLKVYKVNSKYYFFDFQFILFHQSVLRLYVTISFKSRIEKKDVQNRRNGKYSQCFLAKQHTFTITEFVLESLELGVEIQLFRQN